MTMVLSDSHFAHDVFGFMRLVQGHDRQDCIFSDMADHHHNQEESGSKQIVNNTNSPRAAVDGAVNAPPPSDSINDEGWLRLSVGGNTETKREDHHHHQIQADPTVRSDRLLELSLFSTGSTSSNPNMFQRTNFGQHQLQTSGSSMMLPRYEDLIGSWGFRPPNFAPQNILFPVSNSSDSSLMMPFMGTYLSRPYQTTPFMRTSNYTDVSAGPSSDFRVIDPPRRPRSGIWFVLQASQNQTKEPFLPQIPKSYLRIKDGKMTIQLVMKYLMNKLQVENESEIEVRCRGQELYPYMTLQHVRDRIWNQRDTTSHLVALPPQPTTSQHVMLLHYGRTT